MSIAISIWPWRVWPMLVASVVQKPAAKLAKPSRASGAICTCPRHCCRGPKRLHVPKLPVGGSFNQVSGIAISDWLFFEPLAHLVPASSSISCMFAPRATEAAERPCSILVLKSWPKCQPGVTSCRGESPDSNQQVPQAAHAL